MFGIGPATRVCLAVGSTDMRKASLPGRQRPWVCAKRLEKGRFRWPEADGGESKITLSQEELTLLIGGIDLAQTSRRARHRIERTA